MKKIILLSYFFLFLLKTAHSQYVQRPTYFSASGSYNAITGLALQSNVGELMAGTFSNSSVILTQGYVQPEQPLITFTGSEKEVTGIRLFPNPVTSLLTVVANSTSGISGFEVYDANGKRMTPKIVKDHFSGELVFQIDLDTYPPGIYIVRIIALVPEYCESYKISKL